MDGKRRSNNSDGDKSCSKYEDPPNSRLFIVCGKQITEEQFREAFGYFGEIEEVWMVKDKTTQEPKGVTYIKFSKTSSAATAMEEMNGRCIAGSPRPLKVLIAHSRDQGSRRDTNEEERLLRLFVVVPKSLSESDLKEKFSRFGDIDYVSVVRDRTTKESKGFGYVKYHRMSHAARAFEECDRIFKPVFADPRPQKRHDYDLPLSRQQSHNSSHHGSHSSHSNNNNNNNNEMLNFIDSSQSNPDGICRLMVYAASSVTQDQVWKLFDLIPGLDYCEQRKRGYAICVIYNNPQSAAYAKEKLHGFEYPPGHRMVVKYDYGKEVSTSPLPRNEPRNIQHDLAHLTETIANATALLHAAGYPATSPVSPSPAATTSTSSNSGETYDPSYCSVKLPAPQPLAAIDSPVEERLFVVCSPTPPHLYALKDVFGRFGNLIDVYILNGKTCGYVKYGTKASADAAASALHGQEVCGARLKVMKADPQDKSSSAMSSDGRKRAKIAND